MQGVKAADKLPKRQPQLRLPARLASPRIDDVDERLPTDAAESRHRVRMAADKIRLQRSPARSICIRIGVGPGTGRQRRRRWKECLAPHGMRADRGTTPVNDASNELGYLRIGMRMQELR